MAQMRCYHCGAINDSEQTTGTCAQCGKKLHKVPSFTQTDDKLNEIFDEAEKKADKAGTRLAAGILVIVAGIQLCGGALLAGMDDPPSRDATSMLMMIYVGSSIIFACLGFWAMHKPLPPTVIGLVLYVNVFLIPAVIGLVLIVIVFLSTGIFHLVWSPSSSEWVVRLIVQMVYTVQIGLIVSLLIKGVHAAASVGPRRL